MTQRRIPESRDFVWQALRRMRTLSARELAAITERPKNAVQVDLRYLVRTGYVRVEGEDRDATYTLIRDTGVRPPMFVGRRTQLVGAVDRNTHQRFGVDGKPAPAAETVRDCRAWCPKGAPQRQEKGTRTKRLRRKVVAPFMKRALKSRGIAE